jgi:hypothetical protein
MRVVQIVGQFLQEIGKPFRRTSSVNSDQRAAQHMKLHASCEVRIAIDFSDVRRRSIPRSEDADKNRKLPHQGRGHRCRSSREAGDGASWEKFVAGD